MPKANPKISWFLACFGFSMKIDEKDSPGNVPTSGRKKIRRFSWPAKKSSMKTVPIDPTTSENPCRIKEIKIITENYSDKHASQRRRVPDTGHKPPNQIPAAVAEKVPSAQTVHRPKKSCGSPELSDQLKLSEAATFQKHPPRGRITYAQSQPVTGGHPSPEIEPKPKPKSNRSSVIADSASTPTRNAQKKSRNNESRRRRRSEEDEAVDRFAPVIGMSVIMVTLVIMVLWGRLCAVLCTSAWCYFIPRMRARAKSDRTGIVKTGSALGSGDPDLSSEEYKRRVVLDGFLERNRRSAFGRLVGMGEAPYF
ncbi:uncharacterized protein At5g23160 [Malania oleifera]|uniref:uncharacterized protein At5g23160 n=1 Tax=Malania oleifera TaxID=397392 RepID=UPI0025AE2611|nr:uncharacterized protein At5g23160 [Malania oleifera]